MADRIAITGSKGIIGKVLTEGLQNEYEITGVNLPEHDVRNYQTLLKIFQGQQAVIHLAWNTVIDHSGTQQFTPDNSTMFFNVYKAALEAGVPRVIMASSVHADYFHNRSEEGLLSPINTPMPDSLYGVQKVFMETAGRYYAKKGLEVVCIRFGGVNSENKPLARDIDVRERGVWFSHRDCVSLVRSILKAKTVSNNFALVYGMSDNADRVHDISNPFGWKPEDAAENH